jgi:hypothetical protein
MSTKVSVNTELNKVIISGEPAKKVIVSQPSGSKIIQITTKGPKGDKGDPGEIAGVFTGTYRITGSLIVSGSGISGSLFGTASWAQSASYAGDIIGGYVNSFNGRTGSVILLKSDTTTFGYATTSSNTFFGNQTISGSVFITQSLNVSQGITGNLLGTASWAQNAVTASYILASGVEGLSLNKITSGSATASINETIFAVNVDTEITGSLKVTEGITGSLYGTASWAQNAITASYVTGSIFGSGNNVLSSSFAVSSSYSISSSNSQTASYVEYTNVANKPTLFSGSSQVQLSGISGTTFADTLYTFPGDVVVQGNVTAEQLIISTSVYYVTTSFSSGSTIFGNDTSDTHQFTGSVRITGSLSVTGSVNSLGGFTGSLLGTASSAVNAATASYVPASAVVGLNLSQIATGSVTASVNVNSASFQITSGSSTFFFVSSSGRVGINTTSILGNNVFAVNGNTNILGEINSSRVVVTANQPQVVLYDSNAVDIDERQWIIDNNNAVFEIRASSGSSYTAGGNAMQITRLKENVTSVLFPSGSIGIRTTSPSFSLDVSGSGRFTNGLQVTESLNAPNITGSLFGTASWAQNAVTASYVTGSIFGVTNPVLSASYSLTASYALNAGAGVGFPYTGSAQITGSLGVTGSISTTGTFTASLSQGYVWVGGPGNITTLLSTSSFGNTGANRKYNQSTPATTWSFNHNLGERYPVIETYDTFGYSIIPGRIETVDDNNLNVYFDDATAGLVVATVGGTATAVTAQTASFVTASNVWGPFGSNSIISSSHSLTASYALNAGGSGTGFPFTGSATISGSLIVTGSVNSNGGFTGSLLGTASWAQNAVTASYVLASSVVGLALNQIVSGSVSASVNINSASFRIVSASNELLFVSNSGQTVVPQLLVSGSGVSRLTIVGSGSSSPIFTVQGSQGELFSVSDSLSGSLFSVNDISGLPVLEAFSDNRVLVGSYQAPVLFTTVRTNTVSGNNTIYSLPTSSYDGAFFEYTIKSGSNSRAGQIMSLWSGSEVNHTEVVTMDFGNTNNVKFVVLVSGSNLILTGSFPTANWTMKTIVRSI